MRAVRGHRLAVWVGAPLVLAASGFGLARGARAFGWVPGDAGPVSDPGESALEAALEEVVWRHGSAHQVRAVLGEVLRAHPTSPESETRTLLRLAAVAATPDARAALLSRVCAADAKSCAGLPRELERVAATRPGPREPHLLAPPEAPSGTRPPPE